MSAIHRGWPEIYFLDQLSSLRSINRSIDKLQMPHHRRSESSFISKCISYIDLFMWIWKKISTFSPDLAVTWGFCLNDFCLCPSECMLYECVTMKSLCIFTWKRKYQNQVSPTELVCNQFGIALTSMYQSAFWVGWSKMASQMLAKEHVTVFSTICWYLLSWFIIQWKHSQCEK